MAGMKLQDFDFHLPPELIAQTPLEKRSASRLLTMIGNGFLSDRQFNELSQFLNSGDVMVFNDTKVIKARLFGKKDTGGKIEALVERILDEHRVLVSIRASHSPKPGSTLIFADRLKARVIERQDDLYLLSFEEEVLTLLEEYGHVPLPPYISHAASEFDEERYQTVYAKNPGSVAAPTAGLHFDESLLDEIREMGVTIAYVTLHVGAGTFQPVRVEDISEHKMHSEVFHVPTETMDAIRRAKEKGGRVIAVGTTALRSLESTAIQGKLEGETSIYITPGYRFQVVDRLLTNFHLPKSTLLMLVSAFSGVEAIREAYRHAIEKRYRFFSYGDAMLLDRRR
jgi:S-adenosylmethionine:tRNA ribosyltransferase-isomerase